jgi:D-glycero-alpha-D-manno-heptose-7-phosphate kinase
MRLIRSKAPLRISFCGGGTDVPPFPEKYGGMVLSTTINKYAYTTLIPTARNETMVRSIDYDIIAKYQNKSDLQYNGQLDLVKAVLRNIDELNVKPETQGNENTEVNIENLGVDLLLHSDAPPGSGLGSSSTMAVALVGAFKHWLRYPLTDYEIAELAYKLERLELGIEGGLQDQYAASFGGFNFIEFRKDATVVNQLQIDPEILNELEYHLLLCYTGETRLSANIIKDQKSSVMDEKGEVLQALNETKALTLDMKNALLRGQLLDFGGLLHDTWEHKKQFSKSITSTHIDKLYEVARENGAIGGKILGAGGGGYLLTFCKFNQKHIVARELEKHGGQIVRFGFEPHGLQTWDVENG